MDRRHKFLKLYVQRVSTSLCVNYTSTENVFINAFGFTFSLEFISELACERNEHFCNLCHQTYLRLWEAVQSIMMSTNERANKLKAHLQFWRTQMCAPEHLKTTPLRSGSRNCKPSMSEIRPVTSSATLHFLLPPIGPWRADHSCIQIRKTGIVPDSSPQSALSPCKLLPIPIPMSQSCSSKLSSSTTTHGEAYVTFHTLAPKGVNYPFFSVLPCLPLWGLNDITVVVLLGSKPMGLRPAMGQALYCCSSIFFAQGKPLYLCTSFVNDEIYNSNLHIRCLFT